MFDAVDFQQVKIIAWDFDGVLCRNIVDGRLIWADDFENDIGHSKDVFIEYIFGNDFNAILTGREDLGDRIDCWAKAVGCQISSDDLMDYWFKKDALPDAITLAAMEHFTQQGLRQIITTNNEHHRASYIENEMGFGEKVDFIFASGRMGVAKPDAEYFEKVTESLSAKSTEFLLIDDCAKNISAAKGFGWQAVHFTSEVRAALGAVIIV